MSHYPDSIMPARAKSEAEDAKGTRQIASASDYNVHDEEIRAIEKLVGVRKLPLSVGGSVPTDSCSLVGAIAMLASNFSKLRENMTELSSGAVAVKDPDILGVDGKIPFPVAWYTTLVTDIADDSGDNNSEMLPIDEVELADVSGMPVEGYVTIINDISPALTEMCYGTTQKLVSLSYVYAKAGVPFVYKILTSVPANITVSSLPSWLSIGGNILTGTPPVEAVGNFTITITMTTKTDTSTSTAKLTVIVHNSTPFIYVDPSLPKDSWGAYLTAALEGEAYSLRMVSVPSWAPIASWQLTWNDPAIPGISMLGNTITGTPQYYGTPPWTTLPIKITISITDVYGQTASEKFWFTVKKHSR